MNKDREIKEKLPLAYGLVFIFLGLGRLFFAIFDIVTEFDRVYYDSTNFYIWKFASALQIIGIGILFVMMEKRVFKGHDKYVLVIFYVVFVVIGMISQQIEVATTFIVIGMMVSIYVPIAYLFIAKESDGIVRKKALFIFFGITIAMIAAFMTSEQWVALINQITSLERIQIHPLAFFIQIFGLIFLFVGFK